MWLYLILVLATLFMTALAFVNLTSILNHQKHKALPHPGLRLTVAALFSIVLIYGTLYLMGYLPNLYQ